MAYIDLEPLHGLQSLDDEEFFASVNDVLKEKDQKINDLENEVAYLNQRLKDSQKEIIDVRAQLELWKKAFAINDNAKIELVKTVFSEMSNAFIVLNNEEQKTSRALALAKLKEEVQTCFFFKKCLAPISVLDKSP